MVINCFAIRDQGTTVIVLISNSNMIYVIIRIITVMLEQRGTEHKQRVMHGKHAG